MRDAGDLLEWAEVLGNCYGTPREPVEAALAPGRTCCSTSTGRARSSSTPRCAQDVVSVFVLPPSAAELKSRLERRAEDSGDVIARRLRNAAEEISALDRIRLRAGQRRSRHAASRQLRAILAAGAAQSARRADLNEFVAKLLADLRKIAV